MEYWRAYASFKIRCVHFYTVARSVEQSAVPVVPTCNSKKSSCLENNYQISDQLQIYTTLEVELYHTSIDPDDARSIILAVLDGVFL